MRTKWTPAWDMGNRFEYASYWITGLAFLELAVWLLVFIVGGIVYVVSRELEARRERP